MKLELKHLTPYLPYNLKLIFESKGGRVVEVTGLRTAFNIIEDKRLFFFNTKTDTLSINYFKPILRPLCDFNDIDKIKDFSGFNWCDAYDEYFDAWFDDISNIEKLILQCPYEIFQYFLSEHYDVFNLIKFDLAVSVQDFE